MPFTSPETSQEPSTKILSARDLVDRGAKKSVGALRTAYYRIERGELPHDALPPRLKIPGSSAVQVAEQDFVDWLNRHRQRVKVVQAPAPEKRKRGRPTKAEQAVCQSKGV